MKAFLALILFACSSFGASVSFDLVSSNSFKAYTNRFTPNGFFTNGTTIIFGYGDSITASGTASSVTNGWLERYFALYAPTNTIYKNVATNGFKITDVDAIYTSSIYPYRPRNGTNVILAGTIGLNDINGGSNAVQVIAGLSNLFTRFKADGFLVCPMTVNGAIVLNEPKEWDRIQVNTWLRNSFQLRLYDWVFDPSGYLPQPPNTTLYNDGIHPTDAGYAAGYAYGFYQTMLLGRYGIFPLTVADSMYGSNPSFYTLNALNIFRVNSTALNRVSLRETTAATLLASLNWTNNTAYSPSTLASWRTVEISNDSAISPSVGSGLRFIAGGQALGGFTYARVGADSDHGISDWFTYSNNTIRVTASINTSQQLELPMGALTPQLTVTNYIKFSGMTKAQRDALGFTNGVFLYQTDGTQGFKVGASNNWYNINLTADP